MIIYLAKIYILDLICATVLACTLFYIVATSFLTIDLLLISIFIVSQHGVEYSEQSRISLYTALTANILKQCMS